MLASAALLARRGVTAWVSEASPPAGGASQGRRVALAHVASGLAAAQLSPALAEEIPPGFIPDSISADGKKLGEKYVTPNGLEYEMITEGSTVKGKREGPPRSGSRVWIRFAGHVDGFDGKVFDSSDARASKVGRKDYVEITLNREPTITNGMCEALKLMKVGEKGRFVQPPKLSYQGGKEFGVEADMEVKKVGANTTLFYDIELVNIIKP